jgi:plasmid maintenance system antidote protein VapI
MAHELIALLGQSARAFARALHIPVNRVNPVFCATSVA